MLQSQEIKRDKRTAVFSAGIGIYLASVFSFQYTPLQSNAENFFVRILQFFQQMLDGYGFTSALLAVLLAGLAYGTLRHIKTCKQKPHGLLIVICLLFGILNVLGLMMYYLDDLPFFDSRFWGVMTVYLVLGWACIFYLVAHWILFGMDHLYTDPMRREDRRPNRLASLFAQHTWAVSFGVILLAWLVWMVAYYPASMDWDVYRQLCSALSLEPYARSNHDPWLASCVLAAFYKWGTALGSENLGIFLFVCLRNLLIAAIYANCVSQLRKANIKHWICVLVLLFYAVTPVWGAYAKHAFKDTLAAALFCAYVLSLVTVILRTRQNALRWTDCLNYALCTAAATLFRNNPIYAIIPATILLIVYLIVKKVGLKKCTVISIGIFVYFGFNHYIFNYAGVSQGSSAEALSLPFQQTARTVKYHGDEITEEEKQTIDAVLDYNSMAKAYDPLVSDPIKGHFKGKTNGEDAPTNYIKTWATMAFKYPDTYIESAIGGSYGYYAFTPKLPQGAGNWNSGMTIFNWIKVTPFNEKYGFNFDYIEALQPIRNVLHTWSGVWDSLPVLSITDTLAAYTWFAILVGYALVRKKRWPELIVIMAIGILFLTCVASPVNDAFRYYSPIAASVPALLLLLNPKNAEEKEG